MDFFSKIFKGDKTIWCIFFALCIVSLLEVFSASSTLVSGKRSYWEPVLYHAVFLLVGFGLVVFIQRVPTRFFSILLLLLPVSCLMLLFVMSEGESINGARRWIDIIDGFSFQPSELAKISVIGFVAFILSKTNKENEKTMFYILLAGIGIPCLLILVHNLSTALLIALVCFLMMYLGQISWKRLGGTALICLAFVFILVGSLKVLPEKMVEDYFPERFKTWKGRIDKFVEPSDDSGEQVINVRQISEKEFQVIHAKIAIANGGILSLPGSGDQRDVLPQAFSDFIYAIILEEMGFLGGLFVLLLYVALMVRAGMLATRCKKNFPKFLLLGSALILTVQALINMAVAVNLMPVTGQPLPLVSKGGTSILITCMFFGIILACSNVENLEHEDVDEDIANVKFE